MAGKRKKPLWGADFRDESVTRKGKPRKKKANDAENTQQLEAEKIEKAKNEASSEKKSSPKAASNPIKQDGINAYNDDDDRILTEEQARVFSVILFAIGILMGLAVLIPGSEGWRGLHNTVLGLFGVVSLAVPPIIIYSAVTIAKRKENCGSIIAGLFFWLLIGCSAVQVLFVGKPPLDGFGAYFNDVFKAGADFVGGGVMGSFISAFLLKYLGRAGASIVSLLLIFVIALLSSGKGLTDFLGMLAKPFVTLWRWAEGVQDSFWDDDDYDDEYYDEEYDREGNEIFSELEAVDKPVKRNMPYAERINAPEERNEPGESDWEFDVPLPDDKIRVHNTDPVNDETFEILGHDIIFHGNSSENVPKNKSKDASKYEPMLDGEFDNTELERIISNAVRKKERQDRLAAGETVEERKPDPQMQLYILPGLDLLTLPSTKSNSAEAVTEMNEKATKIVDTFKSFGVEVAIRDIYRGPSITRYEIQPGVGVKVSKIRGLEDDIALSLAAQGVRLEAPVPGKSAVGIEVPNINKDVVTLREILSSTEFRNAESKLAFAVGKDITGNAIVGDITKMPHVIIAGTTGSGKSVCTRSIIMSILYKAKPDEVKIILIDPKVVEFKVFEGIPHLLIPIVTEAKKAAGALNWAVNEMMRRYNTFADIGANDLKSYNEIAEEDEEIPFMPQIVIFIDELADMMLVAGKEVEDSICRLAQMGRAAGMHLVVATQRPTTDVITGLIKANIPSRIALSVMSQVDSRTIIDMAGADKLLGNGDMLYMPIGTSKPVRIQGCFASTKDINETLGFIRSQATGEYDSQIVEAVENFVPHTKGDHGGVSESGFEAGTDEDYVFKGAEVAVANGQISTTLLQRKLKLGYARASRIMDELEERGIIGPSEGAKPRKVLMSQVQFDEWKMRNTAEEE